MSLIDALTGLYNRRGILTFGQQQLKIANRTKRALFLLFADVDRMKWINDTFGHRYRVSVSLGVAAYDPEAPCLIDELCARADALMYADKRSRGRA